MNNIVYIANTEDQNIEVWELNNNSEMKLIQKVKTDGQVQPIEIIREKKILYAGIRPNNRIISYCIQNNGLLEKKNESYIPGPPNHISFDNNKQFLFCSSYHGNCISISRLDKYGIPEKPMQIIHNIQGCHAAKMHGKFNILFVTALKEDCIHLYHLNNFGVLTNTMQKFVSTENKSGPRHIALNSNQDCIYTINELHGTIDVWKIYIKDNMTKVKKIQNIKISNNESLKYYWSSDIHLTSCGRFLYVSDRQLNIISLFHVNQHNEKIVFVKSYHTEECPRTFNIDSNNLSLIVCGQKSNKCTVYKISHSNGELTRLNTYNTGRGPIWILIYNINEK